MPTPEDMTNAEKVYLLTTSIWNPHDKAYLSSEYSMLNWEVNLIDKKNCLHFLLSDIEKDAIISVTSKICNMEMRAVETLIDESHQYDGRPRPIFIPYPREVDQVSIVLASISLTLDDALLCDSLRDRAETIKFKSSIGSTNGMTIQFLVDDDTQAMETSTENDFSFESTDVLYDLYAEATKGNIYLDYIVVSAVHASRPKGIDASHLSKIWIIYLDSEKRTLEVTSHHSTRSDNSTLSHNFGTNYCMLQYKMIK